jgi:hypothetical protein
MSTDTSPPSGALPLLDALKRYARLEGLLSGELFHGPDRYQRLAVLCSNYRFISALGLSGPDQVLWDNATADFLGRTSAALET